MVQGGRAQVLCARDHSSVAVGGEVAVARNEDGGSVEEGAGTKSVRQSGLCVHADQPEGEGVQATGHPEVVAEGVAVQVQAEGGGGQRATGDGEAASAGDQVAARGEGGAHDEDAEGELRHEGEEADGHEGGGAEKVEEGEGCG